MTAGATCDGCGAELPKPGGTCPRCALAGAWAAAESAPLGAGGLEDLPVPPEELVIADTYQVLEVIGRGAMGVVYKARQRNLARLVAVKMMTAGRFADEEVRRRFATEAHAAASLNHPSIVTLYDWGEHEGCPYFSMELLPGGSLADLVRAGPIEPARAAPLIEIAARAIHHAHGKGILHRDLKPANILLDAAGVPKVADFGLAKAVDENHSLTTVGQILGTPGYMAPEQVGGGPEDLGVAGDVYGLGAVLYHLLTGRPPFQGASIWQTLRQVNDSEPAPPRAVNPNVPEDLEVIVLKALRKMPQDRYATAADLADDLSRWVRGEPIRARRAGPGQRFIKWSRRNRTLAGSLLLLALSLLVGSAVSLRFGVEAARSSREATAARENAEVARNREEQARRDTEGLLYVANMGLAQQAWELGDYSRLTNMLWETAAFPHRGFEWFYWKRLAEASLRTLSGHAAPIASVAFSADSRSLYTGSWDGTVRVWDPVNGTNTAVLRVSDQPIRCVVVARANGWFAAAGDAGFAQVWDADGQRPVARVVVPESEILALAFAPRSPVLYTAGSDRAITVWRLPAGERVRRFEGHSARVVSLAPAPLGDLLASAGSDGTVVLWDAETGSIKERFRSSHGGATWVAFSADGNGLLTGMEDGNVCIRNLARPAEETVVPVHRAPVMGLAAVPGGTFFVSVSKDCTAKVWDSASLRPTYSLLGHAADLYGVAVSPDGAWLATAGLDGLCKLWAVSERNERITLLLPQSPGWINDLCVAPEGNHVYTGTQDGVVRRWDVARGRVEQVMWEPRPGTRRWEISGLGLSRDGSRLVVGYGSTLGIVLESSTGRVLGEFHGPRGGFGSLAFSPDGNRFVTGGLDHTATVWDIGESAKALVLSGHGDVVSDAEYSPDGSWIATCSNDETVRLWDAASGREIRRLRGPEPQHFYSVAFSPDGRWLASGGNGRTAVLWEVASGEVRSVFRGHLKDIQQLVFSPDSGSLLTGAADSTARLWNLAVRREVMVFKGHGNGVRSVAFSADGTRIVTGSWDGTAKVWEAAGPDQVIPDR